MLVQAHDLRPRVDTEVLAQRGDQPLADVADSADPSELANLAGRLVRPARR
jgi:hypothetical protein